MSNKRYFREYERGNQDFTIQYRENWQHWVQKTHDKNKTKK